ncbi:MAG TPA: hypothetical protein VLA88_05795 [Candidatus Saccharimonadales bacterium]|nr:hypothetical protein [Candidatus Saccharimonadales bacterium]
MNSTNPKRRGTARMILAFIPLVCALPAVIAAFRNDPVQTMTITGAVVSVLISIFAVCMPFMGYTRRSFIAGLVACTSMSSAFSTYVWWPQSDTALYVAIALALIGSTALVTFIPLVWSDSDPEASQKASAPREVTGPRPPQWVVLGIRVFNDNVRPNSTANTVGELPLFSGRFLARPNVELNQRFGSLWALVTCDTLLTDEDTGLYLYNEPGHYCLLVASDVKEELAKFDPNTPLDLGNSAITARVYLRNREAPATK